MVIEASSAQNPVSGVKVYSVVVSVPYASVSVEQVTPLLYWTEIPIISSESSGL